MPKKIRELKAMLKKAGFTMRVGKGSHTNWYHPRYPGRITIAGNDGADARRYLEIEVQKGVDTVEGAE